MKADILRRVEELSDEDEESDGEDYDEDDVVKVKLGGDGEESDGETGERSEAQDVETILELAYIADPKQFDRDAQTRRSQARTKLRAQTGENFYDRQSHPLIVFHDIGLADEQIEGWRVMLERDVSTGFYWLVNFTLMLANLDSRRRKTKSSRSMSFLETNRARLSSHEVREDPNRPIRRERAQVVVVEGEGVGEAEAGGMVGEAEAEAGMPMTGL